VRLLWLTVTESGKQRLPSEIIQLLENFRPLMQVEVFETFTLLITGLLVGDVKHGTVR
jgi:hypothetical protein